MNAKGVCKAPGMDDPSRGSALLNSMVFFWPTRERLRTMIRARANKGMCHDLLVVDTAKLVESRCDNIRLSPMNSGATKPVAHPRRLDLFKRLEDFPFDDRLKSHQRAKAVAEVCVVGGIRDIGDVVVDIRTAVMVHDLIDF